METKLTEPIKNSDNQKKEGKMNPAKVGAMAAGGIVVGAGGAAAAATFMNKDEEEKPENSEENATVDEKPVVEKVNNAGKPSGSNHSNKENNHNEGNTANSNTSERPEAPVPNEEPVTPGEEPVTPSEESKTPGEEPVNPGEEPVTPGEEPKTPGEEPVNPGEEPKTPGEEPVTPGENPVTPGEDPVDPIDEIIAINEVDTNDSNPEGFYTFQEVETVAQIDGTDVTAATFTTEGSDTQYAMIDLDNDGVFDVIVDENQNVYADDVSDVMVSDAQYMINSENDEYLAQTDQESGDTSITGESYTDDTIIV